MCDWWRCPGPAWVLAAALCLTQTACGKDGAERPDAKPSALRVGPCTLTGNFREANADAFAVHEFSNSTLCLAAHGMGENAGVGQSAARRAVEVLARELKANLPTTAAADENQQVIRRAL